MTQEASAKKDTQRLQRAIVDGLEDVKAQDIQVFNTEHLSPLFERVIVASGTSNRQTKALASSVVDAVREAGFPKPRVEGEENGEWIIVDCGAAVAHVMQPAIREYYHLEASRGEKPVRLRLGAPKPAMPESKEVVVPRKAKFEPTLRRSSAVKTAEREAKAATAKKTPAKKAPAKKKFTVKTTGKAASAKSASAKSAPAKSAAKKAPAKKAPAKSSSRKA